MTQKDWVLNYMKRNGSITSMDAFNAGITRLAAIIFTLRDEGHDIESEKEPKIIKKRGTHFARYVLRT